MPRVFCTTLPLQAVTAIDQLVFQRSPKPTPPTPETLSAGVTLWRSDRKAAIAYFDTMLLPTPATQSDVLRDLINVGLPLYNAGQRVATTKRGKSRQVTLRLPELYVPLTDAAIAQNERREPMTAKQEATALHLANNDERCMPRAQAYLAIIEARNAEVTPTDVMRQAILLGLALASPAQPWDMLQQLTPTDCDAVTACL